MKKVKMIEGVNVSELTELLKDLPGDFDVSICGMGSFSIMTDYESKSILMDDSSFIEELFENEEVYEKALS